MFSPQTALLDIDSARLEVASWGPPPDRAPTIVLLHEGLGCLELWRDVPAKLAAATCCGIVAYSRAGYGRSSPITLPRPLDYMSREALGPLPRLLDAVGFQRGVLIGHSDGASIAAIYAGAFDDLRLKGVALMAPHFFAEPEGLRAIQEAERAFAEGDLKARLSKYHDDVDGAFFGWSRAWLDPRFRQWNIADSIDRWRVPALVIQGVDDAYGTLKQVDEVVRRSPAPVETLILPDCKHAPQFEAPGPTLAALAAFCRRSLGLPFA